ncbi:MAG: tryptophan synthase subunit alpha [Deltaproteobacteria bacterium RBG_13_52_11]|nr:MAG: tryptophan synthase subunit alpha [Deltaproteobacteria bacterium RBG_13_52_11]
MSRIERRFSALRSNGEKALICYLTAGDPSLAQTREIVLNLEAAGVDCVEVGVPFSDPTADGPIIQAASHRALKNGTTLSAILAMIESLRKVSEIPIVLFGYYNPVLSYGAERFAKKAKKAGVDGILVVDLPFEEAAELRQYTDPAGIDFISLIAPTTSTERMKQIVFHATGFLYYISITGVTGTAQPQVEEVRKDVERIREVTALPLAVGFGISTAQQAAEIAPYADGIVVGSAVVKMIEENSNREDLVSVVSQYAREMKKAISVSLSS